MALDFLDPALVATIERTQLLAQSDEQFTARAILLPLWDAALRTGDQASACVIAHDLSHAQETPSAALDWHRRALAAPSPPPMPPPMTACATSIRRSMRM